MSRTILLVEDNPDDAELAILALRGSMASEVAVARDGQEALDYLFGTGDYSGRDTRVMLAFILLDLKLPKVDGLEVLQRLREHEETRLIPVVVLTSSREERDLVESYSRGANSYIQKPVDFSKFTEMVNLTSAYWLGLNEVVERNRPAVRGSR